MVNNKTKDIEKNVNPNKKRQRAYMNSYEWNYLVLEIVDYLENRLVQIESGDSPDTDSWKNFKDYCSEHNLNWRVIRKMIEFSINTPFESERELANHELFKALKKIEVEAVVELKESANEPAIAIKKSASKLGKEDVIWDFSCLD